VQRFACPCDTRHVTDVVFHVTNPNTGIRRGVMLIFRHVGGNRKPSPIFTTVRISPGVPPRSVITLQVSRKLSSRPGPNCSPAWSDRDEFGLTSQVMAADSNRSPAWTSGRSRPAVLSAGTRTCMRGAWLYAPRIAKMASSTPSSTRQPSSLYVSFFRSIT